MRRVRCMLCVTPGSAQLDTVTAAPTTGLVRQPVSNHCGADVVYRVCHRAVCRFWQFGCGTDFEPPRELGTLLYHSFALCAWSSGQAHARDSALCHVAVR